MTNKPKLTKALEKKIEKKVTKILEGFMTKQNKKGFISDMTKAMLKIIKAEVNIRLQEEKHGRK